MFRAGDHEDVRDLKQRAGVDLLVAPRRHALDAILAGAAAEAGAELRFGRTATGVLRESAGRVDGVLVADSTSASVPLRARFVVGADGVRSRMARWVGAEVMEHHPAANATFFYAYLGDLDLRG
ncbi:MAG: NAD(P)/FAD-dependent oxidoreductase [Kineosporiaceae bacterium]